MLLLIRFGWAFHTTINFEILIVLFVFLSAFETVVMYYSSWYAWMDLKEEER